ncbi:MAG: hypothetical protein IJX17_04940 [Clostridia bacterium]|nr:hypothetical protein [Clostridia bacterium]
MYDDYLKDLDKITKKYDDMLVKYNGMLKSFDAKLEVYLKEKKILEEKKAICIDCIKRLETVKTALESIQNLMEYCIKYINSTKEEIVRLKDDLNSHLEKLYKYKKSLEKLEEDFKEIKFKRSHQIDYLEDEYIRQDKTYGNIKNIDFNDFLKRIKETFKNYVNDIEAYEKLIQNISSWDDDNIVKVYEIIKTIKLTLKNYVVESFRLFGIELSYLFDIFYNYRALYNDIDDKFWNVLNCYNIRNNYKNIREFKYKDAINTEIPDFKIHNNKG